MSTNNNISKDWISAQFCGGVLKSSSEADHSHNVSHSTLNYNVQGAYGWAALKNDNQYIQISLSQCVRWMSIKTQGRGDADQWVKDYYVQYSINGTKWNGADDARVFEGNTDRNTIVEHIFEKPFIARVIRIVPITFHAHMALRFDAFYLDERNDKSD